MTAVKDLGPLDWRISIVDKTGRPTPEFQRRWEQQRSNNDAIGSGALPTITLNTSEALSGSPVTFVNFWTSGGLAAVRNADNTDDTKPCYGYVIGSVANGASCTVNLPGSIISGFVGLTPGEYYYLGVHGAMTVTRPTSGGLQQLGIALSTTTLLFHPQGVSLL